MTTTTDDAARLAQMRRALFERRVRAAGSRPAAEPHAVNSRIPSGPLPLSVSQYQLWYLSQLAADSPVYNELITIHKAGVLDEEALRRALTEVVARHEAWRTTFDCIDGVPHQFVHEPMEVDLPLVDLSRLNTEEAKLRAVEIAAADTLRPYDLTRGPLIRPRLIRIAEDDHRLCIGLHHLIFDGTTLNRVVFAELVALYRSYAMGASSSLPDPQAQYADYTMWELEWVRRPEIAARIARWRSRLADITPTQLPFDHPRPPRQTFVGGTIPLTIEHATVDGLRRAARSAGGTLFHALAAAYAWWLQLYTESTDVVFGTPHDLRHRSDLLGVAGYCVTPVVVRCEVSGEECFTALVGRIRRAVIEALGDVVPFETLVAGLDVPRDPRHNPLFQTALAFEPPLTSAADDWSLHLMESDVSDAVGSAKFDISIELDERPEGHIAGRFFFSTDLFDRQTASEMALQLRRLLDVVAVAPESPMADHDLVTPDARQRQLGWKSEAPQDISSHCVHEVISSQVDRTPGAVAVQVGDATLTYRQLDDRAAAIASRLVAVGAGPGAVVAVFLDRTPDLVAALLGILKSGAAYLPLDPRQPAARNTYCISDAGASFILVDRQLPTDLAVAGASVISLGDYWPPAACHVAVSPSDLGYVMYTSGSTGRPKGVLVEHRNVVNLMHTMFRAFGVTGSDTVLSVAAVTFDMAVGDIFCALACGARLVLATGEQAMNPAALSRLIADTRATYMMATPTTWAALIAAGWSGNRTLTAVPAGEALTDALADALLQKCRAVWNAWGPTETTVVAAAARLTDGDTVTVGTPLPGVRVYVVDSRGREQPVGVPGEIAVGGAGVARGYLNQPDAHARRFGDDPFHAGGRIYRTGDRGRFLPDGRIQHLGRYDDQLKIRGYRIEPGEIESTLCEHPDVGSCAVVGREASNGERQLVAYIVGEAERPSGAEAREWLRRRLPEYMVPSAFVHLRTLPTTASGKLDKAALPAPSPQTTGRIDAQSPRNGTERRVAELWAGLLGVTVTDVDCDFFDMGGHSLLAARLIVEVERAFGVALSLAAFLDNGRTVAGLAKLLGTERHSGTDEVKSVPPLHFIFSDLASAMSLRHFTAQWGAAQPVHPLILDQPGGQFDLSVTIEQRASQALSMIRDRQPDGPLALVGYSMGGLVAYEVARQAVDGGRQVDWLGILDALAPSLTERRRAQLSQLTLRGRHGRLRQLPARERWAKYADVAIRVLRSGPGALRPPPSLNDFDLRGALEVACLYRQPGHEVPIHLFVSEDSAADVQADLLGWEEFHKGALTVERLAGDHATVLELPKVEQLARLTLGSLDRARALTRIGHPEATQGVCAVR
ncbi:MAG: amino acid adenylation domain-containing protein [Mycobacterium sp.]|uniref:non-ribosomal peptide synthetase n=1 Tax=Mycobacterium sp. TaxID=1785 RepID=UPI003CC5C30E